jgi:hypothetical protein
MSRLILGLMGEKESGKSTVGKLLADNHGFTILEPGMQVMDLLLDINPHMYCYDTESYHPVRSIYNLEGYVGFKRHPEGRRLLQELGTRIRERDPIFWVEQQRRVIESAPENVVNTSVRFPNEAEMIRAWGGEIIEVVRPGQDQQDDHVSEHAWRDVVPDFVMMNDGTESDLADTVSAAIKELGEFWVS